MHGWSVDREQVIPPRIAPLRTKVGEPFAEEVVSDGTLELNSERAWIDENLSAITVRKRAGGIDVQSREAPSNRWRSQGRQTDSIG